ncbi:hypothetical protein ACOMHN_046270 [Nucella lapillus]
MNATMENLTPSLTNLSLTNLTDEEGSKPGPLISLTVPLVMSCTGALGNVLALTLLWRSRKENGRSVFYRLVAALAVTDLFGILVTSPVTILTYSNNLQWVGGQPLCHYSSFMMIFAGLATVLLVLCMAVERCLAILAPYFYERHVAPERVKALLAAVWIVAVLISCLPLVNVGRNKRHYPGTWCFFDYLSDRPVDKVFSVVYAVIGLSVIASTAICNVAVMIVLLRMRRVSQNIGKSREGRTVTNMTSEMQMIFFLAGIILVFATCYCPLMVRVLINVSGTVPMNVEADLMAIRLASLNQILDPWVYLLLRRRLAAILYSTCKSVSPLHMASLKTLKSEHFNNSPRNSPATKPRAGQLLGKLVAGKHGLNTSLAFKGDSSSPTKKREEEHLPLKAESPELQKPAGGLDLKGDFSVETKEGRSVALDAESPVSLYSRGSQASLVARSGRNSHCGLDLGLGVEGSDREGFLEDGGDCVDGASVPVEGKVDQNEDCVPSAPPMTVTSADSRSEVLESEEEHREQGVKPPLNGEEIQQVINVDRHSQTSENQRQSWPANDQSNVAVPSNTHTISTVKTDHAVPNGTLPNSAQETKAEADIGSNSVMSSSASWPVVCHHGNQAVVKMEDGDRARNGTVWNKRHSSVETSCRQCQQTAAHDLTYV